MTQKSDFRESHLHSGRSSSARPVRWGAFWIGVWIGLGAVPVFVASASDEGPPPSKPQDAASTQPATSDADDALIRKLLGGESTALGTIEDTLENMDEATRLLTTRRDAGEKTQAVQEKILAGLDRMITEARKNQGTSKGGSRRRQSVRPRPGRKPPKDSQPKGAGAPDALAGNRSGGPAAGGRDKSGKRRSALGETGRGWGYLPDRDRDEIIQGFDETFMSKYREQIERYYRLLAREKDEE